MSQIKNMLIVLILITSIGVSTASIIDDAINIAGDIVEKLPFLGISHSAQFCAKDAITGQPVYMTQFYLSNTVPEVKSALAIGYSSGSGTCVVQNIYSGYSIAAGARAVGYQESYWSGSSSESLIYIMMQPLAVPRPVIIPPEISRLWEAIMSWLASWLPLMNLAGGSSVNLLVNVPYTTSMSLDFAPPDTAYSDGSYTAKFGEWIILDSAKNLKYESGWSNELTLSPWTATATFTPLTTGKYFLIGLVSKQTYTWDGAKWVMVENIETKEVQELIVNLPNVPVTKPSGISAFLAEIFGWLKGLFSWLPW